MSLCFPFSQFLHPNPSIHPSIHPSIIHTCIRTYLRRYKHTNAFFFWGSNWRKLVTSRLWEDFSLNKAHQQIPNASDRNSSNNRNGGRKGLKEGRKEGRKGGRRTLMARELAKDVRADFLCLHCSPNPVGDSTWDYFFFSGWWNVIPFIEGERGDRRC